MTKSKMSSRERVLATINHEEPDKIPIDLGSTPSSGISAIGYHKLKKYLGMNKGHTRIYDVVQQLAQPEDEIIEYFKIDVLDIGRAWNTKDEDWYDTALSNGINVQFPSWFHPVQDESGTLNVKHTDGTIIAKMTNGALFFDQTFFPYENGYPSEYSELPCDMDKVLWAHLVHSPWKHDGDPDFWEMLREKALYLRENTDKALMIVCGCNLFEWGSFLRRMDKFLMDLIRKPDDVNRLLNALMEIHLATLEKVCESVGDIVDILRFGDDLGENNGPFMNPQIYREVFKPKHAELCKYVHEHSQMKTFLHSCGSISPIMLDLIDAGYDVINPVQINAANMDPKELKSKFGNKITFWGGGADTRYVLNSKKPAEVKKHVLELIEIFAPGGGFVFNSVHNILPDVPPENIVAMFEAVYEYNEKN